MPAKNITGIHGGITIRLGGGWVGPERTPQRYKTSTGQATAEKYERWRQG